MLDNPGLSVDWKTLSDPFMSGLNFTNLAQPAVRRDFGTAFAKSLFALPNTEGWQGPVHSAFGLHLVRITNVTPEYLPGFGEIQTEVEAVWLEDAKRSENEAALKELISKYRVEVED
jgi:parvulin-like peptidyl-prolyl isomerase